MYSLKGFLFATVLMAIFPLKLLAGELLFSRNFKKKRRFGLLLLISIISQIALSLSLFLLLRLADFWLLSNTLYYFLEFAISTAFLRLIFIEKFSDLIPCAIAGYMTEHLSAQFFALTLGFLRNGLEEADLGQFAAFTGAQLAIFALTALIVWLLFARNTRDFYVPESIKHSMIGLSVITLVVILLLSSVRDQFADESRALMIVTRLFSVFSCLVLLYIRYVLLKKSQIEAEHTELEKLVALERKQFEQSKENIELINIKCHDMRHKIEAWEHRGIDMDKAEIEEMKELIGIYDSSVKTGNDTLDVILTERSLSCEKKGIRLSIIADGQKLGFMSSGDICALFGNAIENAIEAVSRLEKPEDRIVSFQVRENRGMLVITVENYYTGPIDLKDGLPLSTKEDSGNHGFGMKSIRRTAEKYGGEVSISVDELFHLTVLIPIP